MELKLLDHTPNTGTVELSDLNLDRHYIGAASSGNERYALRRSDYQTGKFRWASADTFCSGNGMKLGDRETLKDAIRGVLSGDSFVGGKPGKIVVFTTARELFMWLLDGRNVQ